MTAPEYLFVYGTLRRGSDNEMYRLLATHARFLAEGWFNGRLYQVTWYPGAIPSALPQDKVHGEVYELPEPAHLLPSIDDYEECSEQYPEPREYRREKCSISIDGGEVIEAWVYIYNRDAGNLRRIASGDFFKQSSVS